MTASGERKWFALEVTAELAAADAVEHALNEMNALGTEINHLHRKNDEAITVIGYFDTFPDDEFLRDEIHHALRIYDLDENAVRFIERCEVADQDWLSEWKKHWRPTEIGRFIIAPPWESVCETDKIVIRIEPSMAFGTGTHETTQLCIKAIEENYRPGQSFLDVGTGTGILAIAAAKLFNAENAEVAEDLIPNSAKSFFFPDSALSATSALKIFACDTDADSIKIARENAEANGVGSLIEFRDGPISSETPVFDFVVANLTIDVILPILNLLLGKSQRTLVLSGILIEQEGMIVSALANAGVKNFAVERLGEWIAVTVENGK